MCIMGFPEGENRKDRKHIWKHNDHELPKFEKRNDSIHPSSINSKKCKIKEIHTETHIQSDQRQKKKGSKREVTEHVQGIPNKINS